MLKWGMEMDLTPAEVRMVMQSRRGNRNPYREYSLEQLEYMSENDIVDYGVGGDPDAP